nr:immunoglobulin heavy chain junction region [Macaca mulatta]
CARAGSGFLSYW